MTGPKASFVIVPQVSVNEEWVGISRIAAVPGSKVAAGDVLLSLSTDKADMDVEAEREGYFWPVVSLGDRVRVGAVAGYLSRTPERPAEIPSPAAAPAAPKATRKAAALAARLGVDLAAIPHKGIVRESDVEAFAGQRVAGRAAAVARPAPPGGAGRLDPAWLAEIRRPESGFAALPGDAKARAYREHGAIIGDGVSFGPGAAIYADNIVVGDRCEIGAGTVIRAQTLRMGIGCLIGAGNDILCRHIVFGDMLYLVNRVVIGQGGAFNEESRLTIGHSCLVSSDCLINTAHEVTIGDRSCLSPHVSIYTHSHWQNVLEGYRATFAPVAIGNDVWVTGNCLITPGTVMEDGSQALANSVVSGRIPARTIVSGVPARPIATVRGGLTLEEKDRLMRDIWDEVVHAIRTAGLDPARAAYTATPAAAPPPTIEVQAAFAPPSGEFKGTHFDLLAYQVTGPMTPLADEVRNVLRKHGIRFEPHTWRYRADLGRFNA